MDSTPDTSFSDRAPVKSDETVVQSKEAGWLPSPQTSTEQSDTDTDNNKRGRIYSNEISRAVDAIRNWSKVGHIDSAEGINPTFHLGGQRAYHRLLDTLRAEGLAERFEDGIRSDWNATTGDLTLRLMSGTLHTQVQDLLMSAIEQELDRIANANPSLQPFRKNLWRNRQVDLKDDRDDPRLKKSPDEQLVYEDGQAVHHVFVIEVAYSQSEKSLANKMNEYFESDGFVGRIGSGLAINVQYAHPDTRRQAGFCHAGNVSLIVTNLSKADSSESQDSLAEDPLSEDALSLDPLSGHSSSEYSASDHSAAEDSSAETGEEFDSVVEYVLERVRFRDNHGNAMSGVVHIPFEQFIPHTLRHTLPAKSRTERVCIDFPQLSEMVRVAEHRGRTMDNAVNRPPRVKRVKRVCAGRVQKSRRVKRKRPAAAGYGGDNELPSRRTRSMTKASQ